MNKPSMRVTVSKLKMPMTALRTSDGTPSSEPAPEKPMRLRQPRTRPTPDVRVVDGRIEILYPGERRWHPVSRSRLAREYESDHAVWAALRDQGISRPLPSGRSRPNVERDHHLYSLRLRPEDAARLDGLAERMVMCRSALVVHLVEQAEAAEAAKVVHAAPAAPASPVQPAVDKK